MSSAEQIRRYTGPALFSFGFRPFFLLAGLFAILSVLIWALSFASAWQPPLGIDLLGWHIHEMLFGYLSAVIAGFIMTAVPNWTGRMPLLGWPLALFVAVWIIGRVAMLFAPLGSWTGIILDGAFLILLALFIWREVMAGKNWRNLPVALMISLLAIANLAFHVDTSGTAQRAGIAVVAMLVALIGGRITPSFTLNWLKREGAIKFPAPFGIYDKISLGLTALALLSWIIAPSSALSGGFLVIAGLGLFFRLARWQGMATLREPLLTALHLGYFWLALGIFLLGLSNLNTAVPVSAALHAITVGAFGTMTLAVMTRATLGHTGRALSADGITMGIYASITLSATTRVAAPFIPVDYSMVIMAAAVFWALGFCLFVLHYGPMLARPRG